MTKGRKAGFSHSYAPWHIFSIISVGSLYAFHRQTENLLKEFCLLQFCKLGGVIAPLQLSKFDSECHRDYQAMIKKLNKFWEKVEKWCANSKLLMIMSEFLAMSDTDYPNSDIITILFRKYKSMKITINSSLNISPIIEPPYLTVMFSINSLSKLYIYVLNIWSQIKYIYIYIFKNAKKIEFDNTMKEYDNNELCIVEHGHPL